MRRYSDTIRISAGNARSTSNTVHNIRLGVASGRIRFKTLTLQENQRLDAVAGLEYGDSKLWWIIAAASNVGWSLQVPPGTLIRVPNLQDISRIA
jgi:hypothetical protein